MDVTASTVIVAVTGLLLIALLGALQLIAVMRPRAPWTIANVYGGTPGSTDPVAYFAFNQGFAWADAMFWAPLQISGSIGMLMGERWGFIVALVASVPFWYTAIPIFIWDRDLGFRKNTLGYWLIVWGMWPTYGVVAGLYSALRLLG
jgi:hypothetical protein